MGRVNRHVKESGVEAEERSPQRSEEYKRTEAQTTNSCSDRDVMNTADWGFIKLAVRKI